MSVPRLVVSVEFEGEPVARVVAMTDLSTCRLGHWLDRRHDEILLAVEQAIAAALAECSERQAA